MTELRPYSEYKASGVDWLGDIPKDWKLARLKFLCSLGTGTQDTINQTDHGKYPFFVRSQRVRRIDTYSYDGEAVLTAGDGAVGEVFHYINGKFDYHQRVYKFSDFRRISGKYFFYYISTNLRHETQQGTAKSTVESLRLPMLQNFTFSIPSLPEQAMIVKFLDAADARIRRYIRSKQKLLKLLNEQKQAIIQQAVTQGINPNVRFKDSGVEWLGNIPEDWQIRRLKTLFRECDDRTKTGQEILFSLRMYEGLVPHNEVSTRPINPEDLVGYKRVQPQQVVMNRMRAAIGLFGVMPKLGLVSPDYAIFDTTDEIVPEYYVELFKTSLMKSVFFVESKGLGTGSSGFMRLYTDRFGNIFVPKPPKSEQLAILTHINKAATEQSIVVEQTKQQIALAIEYRTHLFFDVVTGKVDVRRLEFDMPEEFDDELLDVDEDDLLEDDELEEVFDGK